QGRQRSSGGCDSRARNQRLSDKRIDEGFGMKKILTSLAAFGLVLAGAAAVSTAAVAAEEAGSAAAPTHFPIHEPKEFNWSFSGPFGTYDKAQLQRGLQVYKEVCSACHSLDLVAFRTLADLGYSEAQVKAFAAEYT